MTENDFWLMDRIQKIKQIIGQYGEEQFYLSFSGGKDSCVLSALLDEALPGNRIPRVYFNTGIEFTDMVKYVKWRAELDDRIVIMKPVNNIRKMLEEEGYPFKSKDHSQRVWEYQSKGYEHNHTTLNYANRTGKWGLRFACPKILQYQFSPDFKLKISKKCCDRLKKDIGDRFAKENNKKWCITGIRKAEGGARTNSSCVVTKKKVNKFNPIFPMSDEWCDWYADSRMIVLCSLYYPPFNFDRTGCVGCPYNIHIQKELEVLQEFLPRERERAEAIWKPVYDEYRRIGYRLKPREDFEQMKLEGKTER